MNNLKREFLAPKSKKFDPFFKNSPKSAFNEYISNLLSKTELSLGPSSHFSLGRAYLGFFIPILDQNGHLIFQKSCKNFFVTKSQNQLERPLGTCAFSQIQTTLQLRPAIERENSRGPRQKGQNPIRAGRGPDFGQNYGRGTGHVRQPRTGSAEIPAQSSLAQFVLSQNLL